MMITTITIYDEDKDIATFLHECDDSKIILSKLLLNRYITLYDISRDEAKKHFKYGILISKTKNIYGIYKFIDMDHLIHGITCCMNSLKNKEDYIYDDYFIPYCINNIYNKDDTSINSIYKEFNKFIYLERESTDSDRVMPLCKDIINIPSLDTILDTDFSKYDIYTNRSESDKYYKNTYDPIDPNDFVYMCKNYYNEVLAHMEQWLFDKQVKIDIIKKIMKEEDMNKVNEYISTYVTRRKDDK